MAWSTHRASVWQLAATQHGVISRCQLAELGLSRRAIEHRIAVGRLHPVMRGVYAVGRPEVSRHGEWMAAVLCCEPGFAGEDTGPGPSAALSHGSGAALWGIADDRRGPTEVTVLRAAPVHRSGLWVHRRPSLRSERLTVRGGIPVTEIVQTLVDLAGCRGKGAARIGDRALERMVNEADRLDLVDPEDLRGRLAEHRGEPGVARLRSLLDRHTFQLSDSELERHFLRLVRRAGLPVPLTQQWVNGFRVDFHWPGPGLVVETDGLRYHRTPAQQSRDLRRDRAHAAAGVSRLRFTHWEVVHEPAEVARSVAETISALGLSRRAKLKP